MATENFWEALLRHAKQHVELHGVEEFEVKGDSEPHDPDNEDLYFIDDEGQRYRLVGMKAVLQPVNDPAEDTTAP